MVGWVRLKDGTIVLHTLFRCTRISLEDLEAVLYHYHAAVGFDFLWEFCGKNEQKIEIDFFTFGRSRLLKNLETDLSGFSLQRFKELFKVGDVVDALEIWKRGIPKNSDEATG